MKKSTRTFLFALFTILFLATIPFVIGYSQGYRIDWHGKTIVKTGALYLEPRPAPVELYMDGKLRKKSSFVFQNIFVGNLIPKKYNVEIKKEGYTTWQKNLTVASKLVTESHDITLFLKPSPEIANVIRGDLEDFSASPSGKYFAFVENKPVPNIAIYKIAQKSDILTFRAPDEFAGYKIENMQWNSDSSSLLFVLLNGQGNKWVSVDIASNTLESTDISEELARSKTFKRLMGKLYKPQIEEVRWSLSDPRKIFLVAQDSDKRRMLFAYNLAKHETSLPLAYDVLTYSIEKEEILYISSVLHSINRINLNTGELIQGSHNPIPGVTKGSFIYFLTNTKEPLSLFVANKSFYLLDKKTFQLEKILGATEGAVISKDTKKLLIIAKNMLAVFWIQDIKTQPFKNSGDLEIIYHSQDPVQDAVWFSKNDNYIIFSDGASIKIIELDSRDKRNVFTIHEKPAEKLFYDEQGESLYFLSEKTLYSLPL